jgi:UDP-N-acetylmuramate dehydrogenase
MPAKSSAGLLPKKFWAAHKNRTDRKDAVTGFPTNVHSPARKNLLFFVVQLFGYNGCNMLLRENISLAPYTTLKVGGPARYLAEAANEQEIIEVLELAAIRNLPLFVLAGGSNIVVADAGFPGLVLKISTRGLTPVGDEAEGIVNVAAGENWDGFVEWAVIRGFAGIECLSGIPGTVGGTPIQNVGAYGEEVSEVIASVRAVERESGIIIEFSKAECGFSYRASTFNTNRKNRFIVLTVSYWLHPGGEPRIQYADLRRFLDSQHEGVTVAEVREAVLKIRASKAMVLVPGDPDSQSVGSFFKNPVVSDEIALRVEETARVQGRLARSESMLRYRAGEGRVKLAAAWLIERAGFHKSYGRDHVGLSSKHTLALVNRGGATASEIVDFMREIQDGVRKVFGIELVPEPEFVGFPE